ncbi:tRNA (guanine(26)-N(2))-dimethyltransferase [Elysia marginata]|uniref:tRNA (guanine(26)-N(2))-dimethyltransferase n=1 Tax=Elysia marginata TaxID=1093978 RepID=A0AAV4HF81_9GAST|nr:tRNA (guanine(26)-N(2))-dimethyltransferase [Elysia marginata]
MASQSAVTEVCEGKARVNLPKSVFYNPVQEYNRDLTIAVISEFAEQHIRNPSSQIGSRSARKRLGCQNNNGLKTATTAADIDSNKEQVVLEAGKKYDNGIRIFEGLAASGLRSVRFGLEIPGVKEIVANDFDKNAVEFIEQNIERNGLSHIMRAKHGDAAMGMYESKAADNLFDVVDLDPYGSPSVFLDATVQSVRDGGLLCITCTDAAVLCGNALEKCSATYGAVSLRSKFCHEMAIRIILQCIDSHANRYSRYIVPLISLSVDFYFRVFLQVLTSQKQVKHSCTKKAMVFECVGCGAFELQPLAHAVPTKGEDNFKFLPGSYTPVTNKCEHCGHHYRCGGPIWIDPLHNHEFLKSVIARVEDSTNPPKTKDRICGMLNVALEELPDVPLYYVLDAVCSVLHCQPPNMMLMRSALLNAGYRVSMSHAAKNSYKTNAPAQVIWDIMRTWIKDHPVSEKRLTPGSVARAILEKEPVQQISFQTHPEANPDSRAKGLLRWQANPLPNWGPKAKAKRSQPGDQSEKRAANQGKAKRAKDGNQSSTESEIKGNGAKE